MRRQEFFIQPRLKGPYDVGKGYDPLPPSKLFIKPNEQGYDNQCSIDQQNKAGIDELPDSSEFIYNLETKTARKALKKVWKNPEAKKEVLAGLDKMN
jgi:hypothetical protein